MTRSNVERFESACKGTNRSLARSRKNLNGLHVYSKQITIPTMRRNLYKIQHHTFKNLRIYTKDTICLQKVYSSIQKFVI